MFFQGDLQEGIAVAIQQAKSVICFVTDGETESQVWESEYLTKESIKPLLLSRAVLLRLEAGSEGERFLTQLYPVPKKPTLVIIKSGELKEYIAAGVSEEVFMHRLQKALQAGPAAPPGAASQQAGHGEQSSSQPPSNTAAAASPSNPQEQPGPSSSTDTQQVQSLLSERAARLEEKRKKDAEDAKRRRQEKGKALAESAGASGKKKDDPQNKHAEDLKKRQRAAREERTRILNAIEDDKAARRARQAERVAARKGADGEENAVEEAGEQPFAPASQLLPSGGRLPSHCALQVRLLDGSTIRSRFSSTDTLRKDVRPWVDETRKDGAGKAPYMFKVLLTPQPNRALEFAEEERTLGELGFAPSATLILAPAPKHAVAYPGAARGNVVVRFIAYILGFISGFFNLIVTFFATLFSTRGPPAAAAGGNPDQARASATGREDNENRIKGMRDRSERRNDQQFYNGNSTNFEPNRDDEDDS